MTAGYVAGNRPSGKAVPIVSISTGSSRREREDVLFTSALRLTAIATGGEAAQLVLHAADAPYERTVSVVSSGTAILALAEDGSTKQPATQAWCRSTATRAITGPSGEVGWVAVAHRSADQFDDTTSDALVVASTLVEAILDSDLEHTILNELAAQLLGSSLAASTLSSSDQELRA